MRTLVRILTISSTMLFAPVDSASAEPPSLRFDPFKAPALDVPVGQSTHRGSVPVTKTWSPELRATLIGENQSMVNVDGELLLPGEEIRGHTLVTIEERKAIFERGGQRTVLSLDD